MENSANGIETINFVPRKELKKEEKEKFNILEIMVILSAIAVVGLLVLLVINPKKEAAEARNLKRIADVSLILSSVSYYNNKTGYVPEEIPITKLCVDYGNEICKTGPFNCTDLVNMNSLSEGSENIVNMPTDPLYISINGTGYFISSNGEGLITVCAPHAERNERISFSKLMY